MPVSNATAWGQHPDGRPLHRWTLRNARDTQIDVSDLGGTLLSWQTPDRHGRRGEVLLGHADASQYIDSNAYMGAIVGRWANRIRGGRFRLDGIDYKVDRNDGGNHLHGGHDGFHLHRWDVEPEGDDLVLRLVSPEGDGGFLARSMWSCACGWRTTARSTCAMRHAPTRPRRSVSPRTRISISTIAARISATT